MAAANAELTRASAGCWRSPRTIPSSSRTRTSAQLQDQLEGTENRIAVARQDYNKAVDEFNAYIRRFPYNLTAKVFGLGKPREYFEAAPGAAEAPKVKF